MEEEAISKKVKKKINKRSDKANNIIFDCLTIICIILIAIAVTPKTLQNDTFYNIKCGEYLVKNGIFHVGNDPFSWHGLPYTWPHWLYDIFTYFVYAINPGNYGLSFYITTISLTCVLGLCLYKLCLNFSKNNKVVSAILTLFALYLMKPYIAARAQLVTFILFVLEILFIEKLLTTNKKRYCVSLLLIAFLIVQLHCAVFPMFFVFAAPYVAEFLFCIISNLCIDEILFRTVIRALKKFTNSDSRKEKYNKLIEKSIRNTESRRIKREKRRKNPFKIIIEKNPAIKTLIIVLIIALLIGFANPFGTGAFTYIYKTYKGNTTNSINEHLPLTLADNVGFAVMIGITLLMLILFDVKIRLSDLLLFAGTLILAFKARRQVSLVIIMGIPVLAKLISGFFEKYDNSLCDIIKRFATSIFGLVAVVALVTTISQNLYKDKKNEKFIDEFSYPVDASEWILQYMNENNIPKKDLKLYNEYNYGSYLLLQNIPVFIDSRCDLYTPEFNGSQDIFSDALEIPGLKANYEYIFEKYGVKHIILYASDDVNEKLKLDSKYELIYNDDKFVIYKRLVEE